MSNLEEMTLKEIKELRNMLSCKPTQKPKERSLGIQIAILQRGWVFVGNLFKKGSYYRIENASCVRNWGTTKGLGELASNGPLSNTRLDSSPTVTFHELTVVALMECVESKWEKKL